MTSAPSCSAHSTASAKLRINQTTEILKLKIQTSASNLVKAWFYICKCSKYSPSCSLRSVWSTCRYTCSFAKMLSSQIRVSGSSAILLWPPCQKLALDATTNHLSWIPTAIQTAPWGKAMKIQKNEETASKKKLNWNAQLAPRSQKFSTSVSWTRMASPEIRKQTQVPSARTSKIQFTSLWHGNCS